MDDRTSSTPPEVGSEIAIVDERTIRDKIYIVRGVKVMLDFELAEIYGYSTRAFNQQVKNNATKFDEDFRFQLTREELDDLVTPFSKGNQAVLVIFPGHLPRVVSIC